MATYKVIQDIEAEDKLIGPLSAVQFIFGCIAVGFLYLSYIVYAKHAAFLLVVFLPIVLFSVFFAVPWGRDQPTEIWALAKLKYLIYPHKRIWNQSGTKNLVTITAPKKVQIQYTNGLTQEEVQGRLKVLAETIDTRGWATKNVNVNLFTAPEAAAKPVIVSEERLATGSMETEAPVVEIKANDDVLDEKNNATAFKFTEKIREATEKHRKEIEESLKNKNSGNHNTNWFSGPSVTNAPLVRPSYMENTYTPEQEKAISEELAAKHERIQKEYNSNIKVVRPLSEQKNEEKIVQSAPVNKMTHTPDPAIINMASSNDLYVSTIAHEANKKDQSDLDDEVVINLH